MNTVMPAFHNLLTSSLQEKIFLVVKNAFSDFVLFDELIATKLKLAISDLKCIELNVLNTRNVLNRYYDAKLFQTEEQKKVLNVIQLIFKTAYVVALEYHQDSNLNRFDSIQKIIDVYGSLPEFAELNIDNETDRKELGYLLNFRNTVAVALLIIPAKFNKSTLLKLGARLEGSQHEYVTGGGQTLAVTRRVTIYQKEGKIFSRNYVTNSSLEKNKLKEIFTHSELSTISNSLNTIGDELKSLMKTENSHTISILIHKLMEITNLLQRQNYTILSFQSRAENKHSKQDLNNKNHTNLISQIDTRNNNTKKRPVFVNDLFSVEKKTKSILSKNEIETLSQPVKTPFSDSLIFDVMNNKANITKKKNITTLKPYSNEKSKSFVDSFSSSTSIGSYKSIDIIPNTIVHHCIDDLFQSNLQSNSHIDIHSNFDKTLLILNTNNIEKHVINNSKCDNVKNICVNEVDNYDFEFDFNEEECNGFGDDAESLKCQKTTEVITTVQRFLSTQSETWFTSNEK